MIKIKDYYNFEANEEKLLLMDKMHDFFLNEDNIFVLTGYAGTGKTNFLQALVLYLKKINRDVILLASTGRAAKILTEKTKFPASTIHMGIYRFDEEHINDNYRTLRFKLRINIASQNTVYIIDEASMISNRPNKSTNVNFSKKGLLEDIISFVDNRKLIIVGDSAQLPPVNSDISPALNLPYLNSHFNKKCTNFALKTVFRQNNASGIFSISKFFINAFKNREFRKLVIPVSGNNDISIFTYQEEMIEKFILNFVPEEEPKSIFIALSNARVYQINNKIRSYIFELPHLIMKNEHVMVYLNNYLYNVFNGENLYIKGFSKKVIKKAGLSFRNCKFSFFNSNRRDFDAYIIEEFLVSPKPGLNIEQERNLMIDFSIRMKKKNIKPKDEELWIKNLKKDPFINALRVRYSYAVTCHKAQGGEWDNVFLVFENYFSAFPIENQYRWTYTAISRAKKHLNLLQSNFIK